MAHATFPVEVVVEALDRQGLLRDISDMLARERINVLAANTGTRDAAARMGFTLEVTDIAYNAPMADHIFQVELPADEGRDGIDESGRRDSDDGVRRAVERERATVVGDQLELQAVRLQFGAALRLFGIRCRLLVEAREKS